MKTEAIKILMKTEVNKNAVAKGCCSGAPLTNGDACCKLDEDKKAEGEGSCGCNTPPTIQTESNCC